MPDATLTLTIAPAAAEVAQLLDAIEGFAESHDLSPGLAHRLGVVVEELAANVAMHGVGGANGATFLTLTAMRQGAVLSAIVEDDGRPFDPLAHAEPDLDASMDDREIGGLGVHFARSMTRSLDYARIDGRNRVTALFDLT